MEILIKKSGSVTILIMLFFVTLVSMIMVFVSVSKVNAVKSTARELGLLWTNSVMAEYDLNMQQRYNLFGFYGTDGSIINKLNFYAQYTYKGKRYVKYDGCETSLFEYSLANAEMTKKQIVAVGKLSAAGKLLKPKKEIKPSDAETPGRIRNKVILNGLPSAGSEKSVTVSGIAETLKSLTSIKDAVKKGTDGYFENQYLFSYFKDKSDSRGLGKTFFQKEIEYVICGKKSDDDNDESIKRKVIAIREALNLAFAVKDPKMNAETIAAAEIVTPGPAALLTQKAMQAAWALAESCNDYKLLTNDKKVPLIKDEHSWAIDLESVIGNKLKKNQDIDYKTSVNYVDPGNSHGEKYKDYLSTMAYSMDENVRLLRIMDLIQINMKYCYYSSFKLRDYNAGLKAVFNINGDNYEVKKEYQAK